MGMHRTNKQLKFEAIERQEMVASITEDIPVNLMYYYKFKYCFNCVHNSNGCCKHGLLPITSDNKICGYYENNSI